MNCRKVQSRLSAYCDGRLSEEQRRGIAVHLSGCRNCASQCQQLFELRAMLQAMPKVPPPEYLSTSLRVLASRESARQLSQSGAHGFLGPYGSRVRLWMDNMMRPLALPLAGGILSAVVLFAMLVPTFAPPKVSASDDVPIPISTEASLVKTGPFSLNEDDIVVDLTVDVTINAQGRVIGYTTPSGERLEPRIRRGVEKILLFTEFNPSTTFGQPGSGKVPVTFRSSKIDVKG